MSIYPSARALDRESMSACILDYDKGSVIDACVMELAAARLRQEIALSSDADAPKMRVECAVTTAAAINAYVAAFGVRILMPAPEERDVAVCVKELAAAIFSQKIDLMVDVDARRIEEKNARMRSHEGSTYEKEALNLHADRFGELKKDKLEYVWKGMIAHKWKGMIAEAYKHFEGFPPKSTLLALMHLGETLQEDCLQVLKHDCAIPAWEREQRVGWYKTKFGTGFAQLIYTYWQHDLTPLSLPMQKLADAAAGGIGCMTFCAREGQLPFLLQFANEDTPERSQLWDLLLQYMIKMSALRYFSWIVLLILERFPLDITLKFCVRVLSPDLASPKEVVWHALSVVAGMMITSRIAIEPVIRSWDRSFLATQLDHRMYQRIKDNTSTPPADKRMADAIAIFEGKDPAPLRTFLTYVSEACFEYSWNPGKRWVIFSPQEREVLMRVIEGAWPRRVDAVRAWQFRASQGR